MPLHDNRSSSRHVAIVAMVRDEEDIIEGFVRHHLRLVDALYIAEHRSTDRTPEILRALAAEGLPLAVTHIGTMAQRQAECMTKLMQQAFADGCDIVVALDADELIVPDRAETLSATRGRLQQLDSGKVHSLRWVNYQTEPWEPERFILNGAWRERQLNSDLEKVVVGREAAAATGLTIAQGNHLCLIVGEDGHTEALQAVTISGLHIAHFPWRSENQVAAKAVSGWITNVAKYSRHTRMANHWRKIFEEYISTGHVQLPHLAESTQISLPHEWGRIELHYTDTSTAASARRRILLTAEAIADASAQRDALDQRRPITIVMLYMGDTAALARTLHSVEQLSYDALQYVVAVNPAIALDDETERQLTEFLERQPDDMVVYLAVGREATELANLLVDMVQGELVQYLLAGDEIDMVRWQSMATVLLTQPEPSFVMANGEHSDGQHFMDIDSQGQPLLLGDGTDMLQGLYSLHRWPSAHLSDMLFHRYMLERTGWLTKCLTAAGVDYATLWQLILPGTIAALWG